MPANDNRPSTSFMLIGMFGMNPLIPLAKVHEHFFPNLTWPVLLRKLSDGSIPLVITTNERSQKAERFVHVNDLADFIDEQRQRGADEYKKMHG